MPLALLAATSLAFASPQGHFSTDEAAECAALYAVTLEAMHGASNVPEDVLGKMRDGLTIWEYELSASAPEASAAILKTAADIAIEKVRASMPDGEGPEAAAARGAFLTKHAGDCEAMIEAAYEGEEHPVIPFLRAAEEKAAKEALRSEKEKVAVPTPAVAVPTPVAAVETPDEAEAPTDAPAPDTPAMEDEVPGEEEPVAEEAAAESEAAPGTLAKAGAEPDAP